MYRYIKRGLDFLLSLIMIIGLSPILLIVGIIIKIDSKGPILFKQDRIGLNGQVFKILKFRSMTVGAEKQGTGVYSFKDDPRVTKVGAFIRKTSIDELPQLVNILKGEMSFIGPRPVLTYHPWKFEEYTEEQKKRFNVLPGVTGLAQLNGRKELEWTERIKFDVKYIENLSFILDAKLFLLTIKKVLLMEDNYNVSNTSNKKSLDI
ncbi:MULTISPECIES: sugar transferase [unclassified Clostridium]|uniref:sugar transferase n=1 Tax=unclassified Clostridium TaxID=2614128 RepID=UPI001C8BBEE6|nr:MULTISPECIES: sugar transferase [unclassified Clostridium]MBX9136400.1 sugar transferase [Clostridium sp. K12(2020)]MBX9143329.1 sugar transferase [Clostridium sp. K13]